MAKLQSTLTNMLLSLTIIALVAAALLGGVYMLTEAPIEQANKAAQKEAKMAVLPIEGVEISEEAEVVDGMNIYRATVNGECAGAAVEVKENGFGGEFSLMVGFDKEGNILGYKVLAHQETPGLGSKMQEWFSNVEKQTACVLGKNPGQINFTVSKDGGDVEAITAATISSRAFLKAVEKAYKAYAPNELNNQPEVEACSGATTVNHEENHE